MVKFNNATNASIPSAPQLRHSNRKLMDPPRGSCYHADPEMAKESGCTTDTDPTPENLTSSDPTGTGSAPLIFTPSGAASAGSVVRAGALGLLLSLAAAAATLSF